MFPFLELTQVGVWVSCNLIILCRRYKIERGEKNKASSPLVVPLELLDGHLYDVCKPVTDND